MRRRRGAVLRLVTPSAVLLVFLASCRVGTPSPAASPVASSPHGTEVRIDWRADDSQRFWGDEAELLMVSDSGLYLLHSAQPVFYPFGVDARIRPLDAPGLSTLDLRRSNLPGWADLALYARHPFGLDADGMRLILDALGRDSVIVRRPR